MRIDNELINNLAGLSERDLEEFGGATRDDIYNHIRLTHLMKELLDAVDGGALSLAAAVRISFVREENQRAIYQYFFAEHPSKISDKLALALEEADELGAAFNNITLPKIASKYEG